MINWFKKIIDNFYFKRSLKRDNIGLSSTDIDWLERHGDHIKRIAETMKMYILSESFNSLTTRDHQRRKDWYDCLSALQKLAEQTRKKQSIDWLTAKPKKIDNK